MRGKQIVTMIVTVVLAVTLTPAAWAQASGATITPNIFELAVAEDQQSDKNFKPAPEKMTTRFGNLEFPGGYPTEETVQKVFDELDLQRATQLYLDMYPALSIHGIMKGLVRDYGVSSSSDVFVSADRLDS